MIFTPTCSGLYRLMGSAKSIDEALITDDVKAIQAKTKAKRADDEQLLLDDLLSQTLSSTAKEYIEEILEQVGWGHGGARKIGSRPDSRGKREWRKHPADNSLPRNRVCPARSRPTDLGRKGEPADAARQDFASIRRAGIG